MKLKRVVVAIYTDPDFYPPTISAILNLALAYEEVIVISRNNSQADYPYPPNVHLKKIGSFCTVREMERQPAWRKTFYFLQFIFSFFRHAKNSKTNLVVLYDHFALFAFYVVRSIRRNKKIWYHSHDMVDKSLVSSYSIGGLAAKYETKAMQLIDFFSLPSEERIKYYPDIKNRIPVFIIPNYPSLKVYHHFQKEEKKSNRIKIIYQGFIGAGHSLEEIIQLLPKVINGYSLELILKGSVTDEYRAFLKKGAGELKVSQQLTWLPIGPYSELPSITTSSDIGIGINMNNDNVSLSQGTASNKIYEYAASGLPIILFDSGQFRKYLDKYEWAFFTDGSVDSLKQNMELIIKNLPDLVKKARYDFEQGLNFEMVFQPALQKIIASEE